MNFMAAILSLAVVVANLDYKPIRHNGHNRLPENLVRPAADGLHHGEVEFLARRQQKAQQALVEFLEGANVDFDPIAYNSTIGLAFSGGGHRAMLLGAGQLSALDSRSHTGGLAGILQASSYIVGLSGGSWMLGTLIFNGFPTVGDVIGNKHLWDLQKPLFSPSKNGFLSGIDFYGSILGEVAKKKAAGFSTTITDIWGRMLMRQLIDQTQDNPWLWSHLKYEQWYQEASGPYPIVTVNSRTPLNQRANISTQIFEVTPYELGTFDPDPYAFTDIEFLGTPAYKDKPYSHHHAMTNLDNAGFILGISSSLFDQIIVGVIEQVTSSPMIADYARQLLLNIGMGELKDVGIISPNPFYEHHHDEMTSLHGSSWSLYLADGGSNKQNVPIQPLLQPERDVDVIFAFDNGGSSINCAWPDGFSMSQSYSRQFHVKNSPPCAAIPDQHTMVNLGLVEKPTFFGCYASNMSEASPLIVYVPNQPYSCYSNTSTFQLVYTEEEIAEMIDNGYNVASMGNNTLDIDWATCIGCAITQRSRERAGDALTSQCAACFERYCWNGTLDPDAEKALERVQRQRELLMGPA